MRLASAAIAMLGLLPMTGRATAEPVRIGIVAPLSGPSRILGMQILNGARAAAGDIPVEIAPDDCSSESGVAAAERLIAAGTPIVVGFVCTETLQAALPLLKAAGIPVITPAVRTDSLTDLRGKTGWPIWRLAPREDAEAKAVATLLPRLWRDDLFAIVDDGTIYGRELAESFRAAADLAALKPVFVDTYRPQSENQIALIARLRKAGAANVFVGGDREDIAIMARDAAGLGLRIDLAGGETLRSPDGATKLAAGTIMIGLPEWAEIADPAALADFAARNLRAEGYVLPSFAAVQIARSAVFPASGAVAPGQPAGPFATALGNLSFDAKGDLTTNPYHLFRYDGNRFVAIEAP